MSNIKSFNTKHLYISCNLIDDLIKKLSKYTNVNCTIQTLPESVKIEMYGSLQDLVITYLNQVGKFNER